MLELSREYLPPVLSCEQVDAFMSAQSLEEQRLVFDQWPIDNLKEAYWYDNYVPLVCSIP